MLHDQTQEKLHPLVSVAALLVFAGGMFSAAYINAQRLIDDMRIYLFMSRPMVYNWDVMAIVTGCVLLGLLAVYWAIYMVVAGMWGEEPGMIIDDREEGRL